MMHAADAATVSHSARAHRPRSIRGGLRQLAMKHRSVQRRPAIVAEVGIAALWLAQLTTVANALQARTVSTSALWWCAPAAGMPGGAGAAHGNSLALAVAGLPMWALMSAAMMMPAALPAVKHVAVNSLSWRRRRATVEFLTAYLAIWLGYGTALLTALASEKPAGTKTLVLALAVAAGWQMTALKRRALGACHRSSPLPARGWRATTGVLRFALRNGCACVGSCWALMLVMALAAKTQPVCLVGLTAVIYAERRSNRPRHATRRTAALLLSAIAVVAFAELVSP
jgi:predicted metal-binding membrane protein